MDDFKKEAGIRLKRARDAMGLSLEEAARRVPGLSKSRLGNWEQGTRTMPNEFAVKLAAVYGVKAAWLGCLDDDQGDQRKTRLDAIYGQLDDRGRSAVLRVAESEQEYIVTDTTRRTGTNGK